MPILIACAACSFSPRWLFSASSTKPAAAAISA
jgi:hypothetical protein